MRRFKFSLIVIFVYLLSGCSQGPAQTYQLARQGLLSGDLSEDGQKAVIGSVFHGGSYWDLQKKQRIYSWNHKAGEFSLIRSASLSGDGLRAVTTVENAMVLWNTTDGKALKFWSAPDRILAIKLNAKGDRALMGLRNGQVIYFNMDQGAMVHTFEHSAEVRAVDLSDDGLTGISGGDDNQAMVWDLKTGKNLYTFTLKNQIKTVAISNSARYAFTTAQREDAIIWALDSGKPYKRIANRYTNYTAAHFSKNDTSLFLGSFQGQVKKYTVSTGKQSAKWQARKRQAYGGAASKAIVSLADNGRQVFALTSDGLWEVFTQ